MHGENGDPMPEHWQYTTIPVVVCKPATASVKPALPLAAHVLDGRGDN